MHMNEQENEWEKKPNDPLHLLWYQLVSTSLQIEGIIISNKKSCGFKKIQYSTLIQFDGKRRKKNATECE